MQSFTLRPHRWARAAFAGLAVFGMLVPVPPLVFGVVPSRRGNDYVLTGSSRWIIGFLVVGVVTCPLVLGAVRMLRGGVWVTDTTVVVRDLFATRRFPRSAAVGLTEKPAIHFRDARGRDRFAALHLFGVGPRMSNVVRVHNVRCLERLNRVLFGQGPLGSRDGGSRRRRGSRVRGSRPGRPR